MERVTGIGGVFFKADDPARLRAWYSEGLGIEGDDWGAIFRWADDPRAATGGTVWAPFPRDTTYFAPSLAPLMINFRVKDLDAMLAQLRRLGATVDEKVQVEPNGRFGWGLDPEGNRFELWEPGEGFRVAPDVVKRDSGWMLRGPRAGAITVLLSAHSTCRNLGLAVQCSNGAT